jgi:hypothetical protein
MYIGYTMNFIKKLFGVKATVIEPTPYAPTYTIGWSIYTKDDTIHSRQYDDVSFEQRTEIVELIKKETEDIQNILNKAAKEEIEFVHLYGNVLRLRDISKVAIIDNAEKSK